LLLSSETRYRRQDKGSTFKAVAPEHLPQITSFPQRSATQVKNQWADLVRAVRQSGGVAVTQHDRVEMVVLEASTYQQMASLAAGARQADQAALERLSVEFDQRLDALKGARTPGLIDAVFKARGRAKKRPKAGTSF
jgi:PHD/YefM family antitoxin component YafN of YafNO toxin-antitoxin module